VSKQVKFLQLFLSPARERKKVSVRQILQLPFSNCERMLVVFKEHVLMSGPSPAVQAAIAAMSALPHDQRMVHAHAAAQRLYEVQLIIKDLQERMTQAQRELNTLQFETLPTILDSLGVDRLGVPERNNMPAFDLTLAPYCRAVIPANWPPEKRAAAFAALTEFGHEDLIKTEITTALPRGYHAMARQIVESIRAQGVEPSINENVHHGTLTAWVSSRLEAHQPLPDLETIGASVGRIVKLKERRE
jgi:hypothetical protein